MPSWNAFRRLPEITANIKAGIFIFFRKEARTPSVCIRWVFQSQATPNATVPMLILEVSLIVWLPRGLRRKSAAARLLRSWVRIPPGAWMFICCECCVLSGRGLCDELITRPEESYRLWSVVVCDLETSRREANGPHWAATPQKTKQNWSYDLCWNS